MIKRRFYRDTHGDKDAPSEESSSSSSGSEVEAEATDDTDIEEEEEEEEDKDKEGNVAADVREKGEASSSSGYESEDSSVNEVNLDSSGLPTSDEDEAAQIGSQNLIGSFAGKEGNNSKKDETEFDMTDYVLKRNSVFKCRICPRIVCLSEETLKAHLSSKKHARSEKLLNEGRLKLMLNDAGKVEGEMDYEDRATTRASRQKSDRPNFKGKGRGKQRKRPRQDMESRKGKPSAGKREKRRKSDD